MSEFYSYQYNEAGLITSLTRGASIPDCENQVVFSAPQPIMLTVYDQEAGCFRPTKTNDQGQTVVDDEAEIIAIDNANLIDHAA